MGARPHVAVLTLAVLAAGAFLVTHAPFAFYSPDGSYHAAKTLRAREGQPFLDPFAGTQSIYPAFFHWFYGALGRALALPALRLYSVAGVANFLGLFVAYVFLARTTLGSWQRAAFAALALPLLFYAPSGRHILVANPANLGIPLLLAGAGLLVRSLRGSETALLGGCALVSLAANVVWYLGLPAAALLAVRFVLGAAWRRPRLAALGLCGVLAPCLFTAWHLWTIREVLPAYRSFGASELRRSAAALGSEVAVGWAKVLFNKGNARFEGVLERSPLAWAHYYMGVLPFAAFVALAAGRRGWEMLRRPGVERPSPCLLLLSAGALTLLLSLALAATGDFPRVVSVQFTGWCLLALPALRWLLDRQGVDAAAVRHAVTFVGLVGLTSTVLHTDRRFEAEPQQPARAMIDFVRGLPGHADERIWVSEGHVRQLSPFVTFKSFVNHVEGRYYSQDLESSARLLAAYRTVRDRREGWRGALRDNGVRMLAFRHSDPRDREIGLFYLPHGRAVLQNTEWWVVELEP